jgi:hypothetical protein
MSDIFDRVTEAQNLFKKILGKVPGFNGYVEQQNRRAADKILRDFIANRYEEHWKRISGLQRDLIDQKQIEYVDDLESSAVKLRQFIDRVRNAAYGYAPFFDAVHVREEELAQVYQYDLTLMDKADEVGRAIDNVETSIGTDGLPAAIRNLRTQSQHCVDAFNHRSEVLKMGSTDAPQQ